MRNEKNFSCFLLPALKIFKIIAVSVKIFLGKAFAFIGTRTARALSLSFKARA